MKRFFILLMATLIATIAYTSTRQYNSRLIYHSEVTMEKFQEICQNENVTSNLDKWVKFRPSVKNGQEVQQWCYVKGKNVDTLFILTKGEKLMLDIQVRIDEAQK